MAAPETGVSAVTAIAAEQPASGEPATTTEDVNVLKRKSDDVAWKYGDLVDLNNNKDNVKCLFCGHISSVGIHRLKQHVANVGSAVAKCKKSSAEAKEICRKSLEEVSRKRREKTARVGGDVEDEVTCVGSSEPQKLGPIDKWTRTIDPKATPAEALHQQKINKELWKQRTHGVQQYVARWMYAHAIPFNAINNDEFLQMCEQLERRQSAKIRDLYAEEECIEEEFESEEECFEEDEDFMED